MDASGEYLKKTRAEVDDLDRAGVVTSGNAFAPVLLLKGEREEGDDALLAGADGAALRAALVKLGYAPEEWGGLSVIDAEGATLAPSTLRLAIATLDPATVVVLDDAAVAVLRETYADELVELEHIEEAELAPGVLAHVLGMRVLNLGGFRESLSDPRAKQLMWARLKLLPPLGEPY